MKTSKYKYMKVDEFISLSEKINGDKFDYSLITKDNIENSKSRIPLKCNVCDYTWNPNITHVLNGISCCKCNKKSPWTLERFIKEAYEIHKDKFDYSKIIEKDFKNSKSNIPLSCKNCNYEWNTKITDHINGRRGCPQCSGNLPYTLEKFLQKAKEKHGNNFDYSNIKSDDIKNIKSLIQVKCNICQYEWSITISNHIRSGCPSCNGKLTWNLEKFLKEAYKVHQNKFDYSKIKEENIKFFKSKIPLICNSCNYEWYTTISNHMKYKYGCPSCSGNAKWTLERLIKKGNMIHGGKISYENIKENDVINSKSKVNLKCNICFHEWNTTDIDCHINQKTGCPNCSGNILWNFDRFVKKSKEIHGEKYNYDKVKLLPKLTAKTKIPLKCNKCSYEWNTTQLQHHIHSKSGCPECSGLIAWNLEKFLKKAKEIHGDKFFYGKIQEHHIKNQKSAVPLICNKCKYEWDTTIIGSHINIGTGCPNCSGNVPWTFDRFLQRAYEIHGNNFSYEKIDINLNSNSNINIRCNTCNFEWKHTKIGSHINQKTGCPNCSKQIPWNLDRFLEKARIIHGNKYNYENIQNNNIQANSLLNIICNKCNHGFSQKLSSHITGKHGCPHCAKSRGYSMAQIHWLEIIMEIESIEIQHALSLEGEYRIPNVGKVDGYCKENNTVYEFHGDFWHGNPNIFDQDKLHPYSKKCETFGDKYQKTLLRDQKIRDLGYNLIVKWETDLEE